MQNLHFTRKISLWMLFPALFIFLPLKLQAGTLAETCPKFAQNPLYAQTMSYYGYRLKDIVANYGCGAISVFAAFGEDSDLVLGLVEKNDKLIRQLVDYLDQNEALVKMLARNRNLATALGIYLQEEKNFASFQKILQGLAKSCAKNSELPSPAMTALQILIPDISPEFLRKEFRPAELETLLMMVNLGAITSAQAAANGFPELMPYMSAIPNDALKIYKQIIDVWGNGRLREMLEKTPGVFPAIIPPLDWSQISATMPGSFSLADFHTMQTDYIKIMHDIYLRAAKNYGLAWAEQYCLAFPDSLAAALLTATPDEKRSIRNFLINFVNNQELFKQLFLPSACLEKNNLALFASVFNEACATAGDKYPDISPMTAMAKWYEEQNLAHFLGDWLKTTNAGKFNNNLSIILQGSQDGDFNDCAFIQGIVLFASIRSSLAPGQRKTLDNLLSSLQQPNIPIVMPINFLCLASPALFHVLREGRYIQPELVAQHLVNYGYPESSDPTLFEYYCQTLTQGNGFDMAFLEQIIADRGKLEESKLLRSGQTLKDKIGISGETALDIAFLTVDVGSLLMPVVTGPVKVVTSSLRVAIKMAARSATGKILKKTGQVSLKNFAKTLSKKLKKTKDITMTHTLRKKTSDKLDAMLTSLDCAITVFDLLKTAQGAPYLLTNEKFTTLCPGGKKS